MRSGRASPADLELPLTAADSRSALPPLRPSALPVLDRRARGSLFYEHPVGSIINPPESTGMGFWSVNPYVGCEFGCTYCYARFAHRYVVERAEDAGRLDPAALDQFQGAEAWLAFEHRIFVKRRVDVLEALERDLTRLRRRYGARDTAPVLLGTSTDPYQPAERRFRVSRAVLERLSRERGLAVGLTTKSPLVCRDIDVLAALQRENELTVHISLISTDVRLIKLFEARSPMPHARLRALEKLSRAGINAGLIAAPVLPGITDSVLQLDALLAAARKAGARFAHRGALRLYASVRGHFFPLIERHFPELATRYREVYRGFGGAPRAYAAALSRRFRRLAHRHGIPVDEEQSREPSRCASRSELEQLPLSLSDR